MGMLLNPTQPPAGDAGAIISAYGPKISQGLTCPGKGRTKQSHKAECDINTIMARYKKTGLIDHMARSAGEYADVSGIDFQSAQLLVAGANSMFHGLPASIRARFDNDPKEFLEFMDNPANVNEAVELGLLAKPVAVVEGEPLAEAQAAVAAVSTPAKGV